MIERIRIRGYRTLRSLELTPNPKLNVLVGDNESGKSTLLEALGLALTGRVNGRSVEEELNPYWFNLTDVAEFYAERAKGNRPAPPTISIEVFLADRDELQRRFVGAHNSAIPTRSAAGVTFKIFPAEEYGDELESYFTSDESHILPVEYYRVDWRTFGDVALTSRPKELTTAIIDSRTIRSTTGVDYHLRQMLSTHLDDHEKAQVSLAYRAVKAKMTDEHLQGVNEKMAELEGAFDGKALALAMDQTSRTSWDASVVPHVADLPFGMVGQGQQAAVKIALAVAKRADDARVVMIEEPENHQSHTHLNQLIDRVVTLAGADQQIFMTTHSSFVLNRLGLSNLHLMHNGTASAFSDLTPDTVRYFQRLAGYETLRVVLARRVVLVEGPADELMFERFYKDRSSKRPIELGIDVISVRGLSFARSLELARALGKPVAVLRDNDGTHPADLRAALGALLSADRQMFIGAVDLGKTLESQLISANGESALRSIFKIPPATVLADWMERHKTEGAMQLVESRQPLTPPPYFTEAFEFLDGLEQ